MRRHKKLGVQEEIATVGIRDDSCGFRPPERLLKVVGNYAHLLIERIAA
jgi:hypothetical protein